jgi:hypothetical protein
VSTTPLKQGAQARVISETVSGAGTTSRDFSIESDAVLVALHATAVGASLDLAVYSVVQEPDGTESTKLLFEFDTLLAPTTGHVVKTSDATVQRIRVVATRGSGTTTYKVTARGIATAGAVAILDSNGDSISDTNPLNVTAAFTGLRTGGRVTEVVLSSSAWTPLPATALSARNAIAVQNFSNSEIKLNYDDSVVGYVGVVVGIGAERFYDITDTIVVYARAQSGTPTIIVEEIA